MSGPGCYQLAGAPSSHVDLFYDELREMLLLRPLCMQPAVCSWAGELEKCGLQSWLHIRLLREMPDM